MLYWGNSILIRIKFHTSTDKFRYSWLYHSKFAICLLQNKSLDIRCSSYLLVFRMSQPICYHWITTSAIFEQKNASGFWSVTKSLMKYYFLEKVCSIHFYHIINNFFIFGGRHPDSYGHTKRHLDVLDERVGFKKTCVTLQHFAEEKWQNKRILTVPTNFPLSLLN